MFFMLGNSITQLLKCIRSEYNKAEKNPFKSIPASMPLLAQYQLPCLVSQPLLALAAALPAPHYSSFLRHRLHFPSQTHPTQHPPRRVRTSSWLCFSGLKSRLPAPARSRPSLRSIYLLENAGVLSKINTLYTPAVLFCTYTVTQDTFKSTKRPLQYFYFVHTLDPCSMLPFA